jgi:hypothetical protein
MASGGVRVEPEATLAAHFEPYPTIDTVASFTDARAASPGRWWWNGK